MLGILLPAFFCVVVPTVLVRGGAILGSGAGAGVAEFLRKYTEMSMPLCAVGVPEALSTTDMKEQRGLRTGEGSPPECCMEIPNKQPHSAITEPHPPLGGV